MLTIKGSQKSSTFNKLDQGYNEKDSFNKWCTFENLTGYIFLFFFESRWLSSNVKVYIANKENERLHTQKMLGNVPNAWTMIPKMNTVWNKIMVIGNLIITKVSYDKHINPFYWYWISNTLANRQKNWFWIQFPQNVLALNDKSHLFFFFFYHKVV